MAGVIRDLLEAQAPGVFFGDQASGLSYSPVIKEGTLEKLGRGRGIIGGFLSKKWAPRTFKVHEDFRMQYIDKDVLRGELPIERARIESIPKEDERAGDKDFVFEITTKEDERVYLAAASEEERSEWIACLRDVSSGKFKLNRYLDLLRQALLLPETQKLKIEFDYEELKKVMNADGYGEERMMEIIEQYLINIHSHLVRYIAEDAIYRDLFLSRFDTFQIRLIHAEDKDTSKGYYRTHFRNGELQIHYVQAWTNIAQCGEDLNKSISEGEPIPYLVYKSIRRYEPTMHSYINGIERLLNITGVSYDYAVDVNYPAMIAGNYGPERFGEIFIQEYLRAFIEKLSRFIAEDSAGFIPAFNRRFKSKRITIQATTNPSAMNGYWKSSFNSAGDLVILYRSVWTNLSQLGEDFTSLLQGGGDDSEGGGGGGVPYKVSKSIREKEATLQAHLHRLEQLLSIRGIQYDYNVQLNLPAMISAGYGEDRFGEIFLDEYIKNLISTIESFIKKDSSFIPAFNQKFFGKKIVIHIASNPNETKSYNDSSFTADGNLLIVYRYVWTNISSIGQDIPALLTEGDVPFIVAESIHKTQSTLQSHLKRIEYLFNISGVTYDYVVASNLPAMRNSGYGDDRFGEIFLDEHLKNLIATFEQQIQEDRVFIDVFNRYFKSRKIVIRPASDPSNTKSYYDSSFTAQGDLLIEYRYVWTNISNIGRDLPSILLDDNDVPYIVAVSIRKTQSTLQSHLHSLEQVFGVTGLTYDYAVASNLPAMRDSGYGDDRFGEIFLDEYLKNLVATVRSLGADPGFASAFRSKFTGRKIIIKIASDPNNLQNYYDSSFTAQGDLLIEYRYVWTNISNIGRDIPTRL